jgi:DNA (cytosine-5)-methyltransferase 1
MNRFTCIDLFCGCGGCSLGMERAGFSVLAAVDFNKEAIDVFRQNFPNVQHILQEDLTKFPPQKLAELVGVSAVDVVVGGPPCQGLSKVRQRDGSNSGPRMVKDSRRSLYQWLLRYLAFFRPKILVMENVPGIKMERSHVDNHSPILRRSQIGSLSKSGL